MNSIVDILPMPPWLGPPFPKFLVIYWPWLQSEEGLALPQLPFAGSYQNEEIWDIEWDEETRLPIKLTIHRNAREGE